MREYKGDSTGSETPPRSWNLQNVYDSLSILGGLRPLKRKQRYEFYKRKMQIYRNG